MRPREGAFVSAAACQRVEVLSTTPAHFHGPAGPRGRLSAAGGPGLVGRRSDWALPAGNVMSASPQPRPRPSLARAGQRWPGRRPAAPPPGSLAASLLMGRPARAWVEVHTYRYTLPGRSAHKLRAICPRSSVSAGPDLGKRRVCSRRDARVFVATNMARPPNISTPSGRPDDAAGLLGLRGQLAKSVARPIYNLRLPAPLATHPSALSSAFPARSRFPCATPSSVRPPQEQNRDPSCLVSE